MEACRFLTTRMQPTCNSGSSSGSSRGQPAPWLPNMQQQRPAAPQALVGPLQHQQQALLLRLLCYSLLVELAVPAQAAR
jgi:hypothetical protein